ncbi:MAG: CsoS2 family carboxysome shell protein [Pseudomonadota bacterium]
MPELTALSGRELARARRAMLAQGGKNGAAQASARPVRSAAPRPVESSAPSTPAAQRDRGPVQSVQTGGVSGREFSRARRAMLAQQGKKGAPQGNARSARPAAPRPVESFAPPAQAEVRPSESASPAIENSAAETTLDSLCEIVEQNPAALGENAHDVRRLCRDRRRALATQGKSALPAKAGMQARQSNGRAPANGGINNIGNGRLVARERRAEMSRIGRGDAPPARPVRARPQPGRAPAKVEVGTTLSGLAVTGTQVERKPQITGGESGTCRVITGTEYIGAEQFETFCGVRPAPGKGQVEVTSTSKGNRVTANAAVGRSSRVTGDEMGGCRGVTGTEYLGSEHFAQFCENKGLLKRPEKVVVGVTERKGLAVTGSDEARQSRVTGFEPGAKRTITGSQYADAGVARLTINGPSKVALTHTLAGRPVTGTEVGASAKVTGEEAGLCRSITGTEYLSNELFQSVCNTRAEPAPAKIGLDKTAGGQRITGNLVDATDKVTGAEHGTHQRVTGSQYGSPLLSRNGPEKVAQTRTLAGGTVTGNMVGHSPKLTGDEQGGCQLVTGTEYYGREHYDTYCSSGTPAPAPTKVGLSQTPRGLAVSGTMLGRSEHVTGNEPGSSLALSGTPYDGPVQVAAPCGCACGGCEAKTATAVAGPRVPSSRSRYLAASGQALTPAAAPGPIEMRQPGGFSITTPARFAQEMRNRITGTGYGNGAGSIITGPAARADGLVSGTPEFRYRDDAPLVRVVPPAPVVEEAPQAAPQPARITGEGRESTRITGDDWARSGRITGTEGAWAQSRNLTRRGEVRPMVGGAWQNKHLERVEVPLPKVTGAVGNSAKGAVITVSGGARG